MSRLRKALIVGAVAVGLMFVGSGAYAIVTIRSGTIADQRRFVHDADPFVTGSAVYVNVPTAVASITIPAGTTRMFDARFTAESTCSGPSG